MSAQQVLTPYEQAPEAELMILRCYAANVMGQEWIQMERGWKDSR